ncbi:MAG: MFS transporter [Deltaproteobacteria bacterium]|nr:MFS transporter [Deltaproteobacteria bacterium]
MSPGKNSAHRHQLFYGWVIVGLCLVNLTVVFGVWYSFSVFFIALVREFGWSRASTASIYSIFIVCNSFSSPLAGYLLDRFGPRLVMPLGGLLLAAALVLVSTTQSLWFFRLSYGLLAGIGASFMGFTTNSALLSRWFVRRRGTAVGIAFAGIGLGMLILVPLAERWIAALGWRGAYLCLAAVVTCVALPLNLVLARSDPAAMGLEPDNGAQPRSRRGRPSGKEVRIVNPAWADQPWTLARAMRTHPFWLMMGAYCFGSLCFQSTLMHAASAMVDAGLALRLAGLYMGLVGMFSSVGKMLFGYISDGLGRELTNTITSVICTLGLVAAMFISPEQPYLALAFVVLFGLGYGGATPLYPAAAADLFMGGSFGLIFAVIFLGNGVGGALGSYAAGLLRDLTGGYLYAFLLFIASLWAACLFIWKAGPRKVRRMARRASS